MASRTMAGSFSIVRPYPGQMGKAVDRFIAGLAMTPVLGVAPPAGTSDEQTARWLSRNVAQLLVVPFHFHRGTDQTRLDGIGALLSMPSNFDFSARVILMPVRAFSWTTSFQPRFDLLRSERPRLADQIIVAHESELSSAALLMRVKRALEALEEDRSQPPPRRSSRAPAPPSTEALNRLTERFSLPPSSVRRRSSGGWKFTLREEELPIEDPRSSLPPVSEPRPIYEEPAGVRPIYQDFIDEKKSNG